MRRAIVLAIVCGSCAVGACSSLALAYYSWVDAMYGGMACAYGGEAGLDHWRRVEVCESVGRSVSHMKWSRRAAIALFVAAVVTLVFWIRARRAQRTAEKASQAG